MDNILNKNTQDLIKIAEENKDNYFNNKPFANIALDDFFNPEFLENVLEEFPDLSKKDSHSFHNTKEIKLAGKGEKFFGSETKKLMHFLNSEPFLNFLQILTGIEEPLIGDPYFIGGGQHEIKKGGLLKVHADFNKHPKLNLDRRINVLVYLNKDWKEEYGGHFELWDENMEKAENKILPIFNRMAIFSTTDFSYHGHPNPLNCPEDRSRKSLALYYFSNGRPSHEINQKLGAHSTLFKQRRNDELDKEAFEGDNKVNFKSLVKSFVPPVLVNFAKKIF
jgi:hypothetical protein